MGLWCGGGWQVNDQFRRQIAEYG